MIIRTLMFVALILSLALTYVAFRILPEEMDIRGPGISARDDHGSPYRITESQMGKAGVSKRQTIDTVAFKIQPPSWRVNAYIARGGGNKADIIIKVFDMNERMLPAEDFTAHIVRAGQEDQALPGVTFAEIKDGYYKAAITLPEEGEWELRASLRRGNQTIVIEQNIEHLPDIDLGGGD